jgi:hypothetical protein
MMGLLAARSPLLVEADITAQEADSGFDPKPTWAGLKSRSAAASAEMLSLSVESTQRQ